MYGVPSLVVADNDKRLNPKTGRGQFTAARTMIQELLGVRVRFAAPAHQQANGLVEHMVRTLKDHVAARRTQAGTAEERRGGWELDLAVALQCYNAAPHSSTGHSPNVLQHGRILPTQLDRILGGGRPDAWRRFSDYAAAQGHRLREACLDAKADMEKVKAQQERDANGDEPAEAVSFAVDEVVKVLTKPVPANQLAPKGLHDRWTIARVVSEDTHNVEVRFHADKMRAGAQKPHVPQGFRTEVAGDRPGEFPGQRPVAGSEAPQSHGSAAGATDGTTGTGAFAALVGWPGERQGDWTGRNEDGTRAGAGGGRRRGTR